MGIKQVSIEWVRGEAVGATAQFTFESGISPLTGSTFYEQSGIPKFADKLDEAKHSELRLQDMSVRILTAEVVATKWQVELDLSYRLWRSTKSNRGSLSRHLRGSSSLHQWRINKDQSGRSLQVNNPDNNTEPPKTLDVDVLSIQETVEREFVVQTDTPWTTSREWANNVNQEGIWGAGAGDWLCTSVQHELVCAATTPYYYKFMFTFERSNKKRQKSGPAGWIYEGYWSDSNGNIPSNATVDNGGKFELAWHGDVKFGSKFT